MNSARDRDNGQGLVEYILILVLVSVALVFGLTLFAGGLNSAFSLITGKLS